MLEDYIINRKYGYNDERLLILDLKKNKVLVLRELNINCVEAAKFYDEKTIYVLYNYNHIGKIEFADKLSYYDDISNAKYTFKELIYVLPTVDMRGAKLDNVKIVDDETGDFLEQLKWNT